MKYSLEVWETRTFDDLLLQFCNAKYNQNAIERWTKSCILPFPNKGDFRNAKNYRGMTLTSIVTKVYNAVLLNHIKSDIKKILIKNWNHFQRNLSTTSQILTICLIIEGVCVKNLKVTLLFVDFSLAFDSIHKEKIEQILLVYNLSKKLLFDCISQSTYLCSF